TRPSRARDDEQPVGRAHRAVPRARGAEARLGKAETGRGTRRDRARRGNCGLGGRAPRYGRDPMIRLHDTLSHEKVELIPRDPGKVSIYVCGPTVYEVPHVGHGREALVFDVISRYLEWRGFDVTFVTNITDVEDKIIARAAEEGSTEPEV